jgi:hypothetical protein
MGLCTSISRADEEKEELAHYAPLNPPEEGAAGSSSRWWKENGVICTVKNKLGNMRAPRDTHEQNIPAIIR